MELTKKTTILFDPVLHRRLSLLAKQKGVSLGELVRHACERQYGLHGVEERLAAVEKLASLNLPVGSVADMKRESVPTAADLLP